MKRFLKALCAWVLGTLVLGLVGWLNVGTWFVFSVIVVIYNIESPLKRADPWRAELWRASRRGHM